MRREFGLVLLAGAIGAGLVVLAVRQAWAHAVFTPPRPLPGNRDVLGGQRPGRGEDGVRRGLAGGEHDQASPGRPGQQHQGELPTHL